MALANPAIRRDGEHRLYIWAACVIALIVFAGFARTFYLKPAFGTPALPLLLYTHGVVMSAWFVLFLTQAGLVASGRTRLHTRIGVFGALLALTIVVLDPAVAILGARQGHAPPGVPPLVFMAIPLCDVLLFAILVGCALAFRRRSDVHKRLMLLATASLLAPALARVPLHVLRGRIVADFVVVIVFVLVCLAYDSIRNRRLHPAMAGGALLIAVSWPLRLAFAGTGTWMAIAKWLTH